MFNGSRIKISSDTSPLIFSSPDPSSVPLRHKKDRIILHPKWYLSVCIVQCVTELQLLHLAVGDGVHQDLWSELYHRSNWKTLDRRPIMPSIQADYDVGVFGSSFGDSLNPFSNLFIMYVSFFFFLPAAQLSKSGRM